jgi:hypothetical protein
VVGLRLARVRGGEWIMGLAGLGLVVVLFALPWYGFDGVYSSTAATLGIRTQYTGLQSLHVLGPLALLVGVGGLSAWLLQGTRGAPAAPVCATALTIALAIPVLIGLAVRVLIAYPEHSTYIEAKSGAYCGLALVAAIVVGAYVSLRRDGIHPADAPQRIETLRIAPRPGART